MPSDAGVALLRSPKRELDDAASRIEKLRILSWHSTHYTRLQRDAWNAAIDAALASLLTEAPDAK